MDLGKQKIYVYEQLPTANKTCKDPKHTGNIPNLWTQIFKHIKKRTCVVGLLTDQHQQEGCNLTGITKITASTIS